MHTLGTVAVFRLLCVLALSVSAVTTNGFEPHVDILEPLDIADPFGNAVDSDSNIVYTASKPGKNNYKSGKDGSDLGAVAAFYDFSTSFVRSAMGGDFPYELTKTAADGDFGGQNWRATAQDFIGFGVALAIGILFIIVVPIAGCCFCCCRCAGRCGGRRVIEKAEDAGFEQPCSRRTAMLLLLVPLILAIAGTCLMFQANENLSASMRDVKDSGLDKVDDVKSFLDNVIDQAEPAILGKYNFTVDVLERDLENIGFLLGQPVKNLVLQKTKVEDIYESILNIETDAQGFLSVLNDLKTNRDQFVTEAQGVQSNFQSSMLKTRLDKTITRYPSLTIASDFQDGMTNTDPNLLPNGDNVAVTLKRTLQSGIRGMVEQSRKDIDSVPQRIQNETETTRKDILSQLADYTDEIQSSINDFKELRSDVLGGIDFDDLKDQGKDGMDTVIEYDKYRWYGGLALAVLALLVELVLLLSIAMGACGGNAYELPEDRGRLSNCAGSLLLVGCVITFILSWLLMFLTTTLFLVSAPVDTMVCRPIRDLTILDKLLNTYDLIEEYNGDGTWLGNEIFPDEGLDLEISRVLSDCEKGETLYTALRLEQTGLLDLDELTNFTKTFDIDKELQKLDVPFDSTSLNNSGLDNFLDFMGDIDNQVNYDNFLTALDSSPSALTEKFRQELSDYIDTLSASQRKNDMQTLLAEVNSFDSNNDQLRNRVTAINENLNEMKAFTRPSSSDSLADQCDSVKQSLADLNSNITQIISEAFKEGISGFTRRIEKIFEQFVDGLRRTITKELGVCTPLYNIYNDLLVQSTCTSTLGSLIAWVCAMGMTSMFLVLSTCMSCNLSKHLYRMRYEEDDDVQPSAPPMDHTQNAPNFSSQVFNNKVFHMDSPPNHVVNNGYYY